MHLSFCSRAVRSRASRWLLIGFVLVGFAWSLFGQKPQKASGPWMSSSLSPDERAQALAIPRALATHDADRARAVLAEAGVAPDYVEIADFDGPTLLIAARVGSTRLIDNAPLGEGEAA